MPPNLSRFVHAPSYSDNFTDLPAGFMATCSSFFTPEVPRDVVKIYFLLFLARFLLSRFMNKPNNKRDNSSNPTLALSFLPLLTCTMLADVNFEQRWVNESPNDKTDLPLSSSGV